MKGKFKIKSESDFAKCPRCGSFDSKVIDYNKHDIQGNYIGTIDLTVCEECDYSILEE